MHTHRARTDEQTIGIYGSVYDLQATNAYWGFEFDVANNLRYALASLSTLILVSYPAIYLTRRDRQR